MEHPNVSAVLLTKGNTYENVHCSCEPRIQGKYSHRNRSGQDEVLTPGDIFTHLTSMTHLAKLLTNANKWKQVNLSEFYSARVSAWFSTGSDPPASPVQCCSTFFWYHLEWLLYFHTKCQMKFLKWEHFFLQGTVLCVPSVFKEAGKYLSDDNLLWLSRWHILSSIT